MFIFLNLILLFIGYLVLAPVILNFFVSLGALLSSDQHRSTIELGFAKTRAGRLCSSWFIFNSVDGGLLVFNNAYYAYHSFILCFESFQLIVFICRF